MINELYELCPRFEECSAPKCPLDSQFHQRTNRLPGEEVCKARKSSRLRIAKDNPGFNLPWGGRTKREFSGYKISLNGHLLTESKIQG